MIDVKADLDKAAFSATPTLGGFYPAMVGKVPALHVLWQKYCPVPHRCVRKTCEFAGKYPGSGKGRPCVEFVRRMQKERSVDAAIRAASIVEP